MRCDDLAAGGTEGVGRARAADEDSGPGMCPALIWIGMRGGCHRTRSCRTIEQVTEALAHAPVRRGRGESGRLPLGPEPIEHRSYHSSRDRRLQDEEQ